MSSDEPESGRATGSAPAPAPTDEDWMRLALAEAEIAAGDGDVPVGAVVVGPDRTELARAHNERQHQGDPTAHAELLALRRAAERLGHWRLDGCTLVVTLEPCAMCGGALTQARVSHLVFGADDPKAGAVTSLFDVVRDPRLPFAVEVRRGILADACAAILKRFFRDRRGR